ncbi:MAG TPA: PilN domain-containing protein [Pyrinomonadaceae bacterium]|jgi:Tfp pilus assembly protein PilN
MIKINLLHSVTERHTGATAAVERKISSPVSRLLLMTVSVAFLLMAVVGWDIISTQMAKAEAERQLEEQKQIAAQLEAVLKEQKELEAKIQNIDLRIEAIKKLRASQAGPAAVLEAVNERIRMTPGLYLESVEQAGEQVTIKGNSPDETAVTQFGRSLEFSGGLFSNLNIETQRKEVQSQQVSAPAAGQEAPKLEIVNFTIRTAYTPSKAGAPKDSNPTTAANTPPSGNQSSAQPGSPAPPQVAKN